MQLNVSSITQTRGMDQVRGSETPIDRRLSQHDRLLTLRQVLAPAGPISVSPSTWWEGVKAGRYPKPVYLGPRSPRWRWSDIQTLMIDEAGGRVL